MPRRKSAWYAQDPRMLKEHGEERASWVTYWYDPDGKRCSESFGVGPDAKQNAMNKADEKTSQLNNKKYEDESDRLRRKRCLFGVLLAGRAAYVH
jgi:hypothetical protein